MTGFPLNATLHGSDGRIVVLANGLGTNQHTWRHVIRALSRHVRVVTFDYVGSPDGDLARYHAERYASLHGFVDDAVELLDALELEDVTWVGHSVSGMIGLLAAVAAPDRIGRLVTIAASPRYLDDPATGYAGGYDAATIDGLLAAVSADYHAWVGGFSPVVVGRADCPDSVEEFASYLRRMRPDVAQRMLTTIFTGDYRSVLPRVTQPVCVIQTTADAAVPMAVGRYLAGHLPRGTYRELRAAGHVPQLTAPDELCALLREVLLPGDAQPRAAA